MDSKFCASCSAAIPRSQRASGVCPFCGAKFDVDATVVASAGSDAVGGDDDEPPVDQTVLASRSRGGADAETGRVEQSSREVRSSDETVELELDGGSEASAAREGRPSGARGSLIGRSLGGCQVVRAVSQGAMGMVYEGYQPELGRSVAIKLIRPELAEDATLIARFQNEARQLASLKSQHVVQIHSLGFDGDHSFLIMEYVSGGTLEAYAALQEGGRLGVRDAIQYLYQACSGMVEAEKKGIVHRDLKPANLLLGEEGALKIADFGIAKAMHEGLDLTQTLEITGTPLFMSPEQCDPGANLDSRSDIYSLGATFYSLMTGLRPASGRTTRELLQTKRSMAFLSLANALPNLPELGKISGVIEKMTALHPHDRYQSFAEVVRDLKLVAQDKPIGTAPPPKQPPEYGAQPSPVGKLVRYAMVAVLLVLVPAALATGYMMWSQQATLGETFGIVQNLFERDVAAQQRKDEAEILNQEGADKIAEENEAIVQHSKQVDAEPEKEPDTIVLPGQIKEGVDQTREEVAAAVRTCRERFLLNGPSAALRSDVEEALQRAESRYPELRKQLTILADTVGAGLERKGGRLPAPPLPFDTMVEWARDLRLKLDIADEDRKSTMDPVFYSWAPGRLTVLLDDAALSNHVVSETRRFAEGITARWNRLREPAETLSQEVGRLASLTQLANDMHTLDTACANAREVFVGAENVTGALGRIAREASIAAVRGDVKAAQSSLASYRELEGLANEVAEIQSLTDFVARREGLRAQLARFRGDDANGLSSSLASSELTRLERELDSFDEVAAQVTAVLEAVGRGEFGAARGKLKWSRAFTEASTIERVVDGTLGGLGSAVHDLDLSRSVELLQTATSAAESVRRTVPTELVPTAFGGTLAYLRRVQSQLRRLVVQAADMAPVAQTSDKFCDRISRGQWPSFFIDRFEVSRADYRDAAVRLWKESGCESAEGGLRAAAERHREKHPGVWLTTTSLHRVLVDADGMVHGSAVSDGDSRPVSGVSYLSARGVLATQNKQLPTKQQWEVAALRPQSTDARPYPWGKSVERFERLAAEVDVEDPRGADSSFRSPVFFLYGNVAEWVRHEQDQGVTPSLVGVRVGAVGGSWRSLAPELPTKRVVRIGSGRELHPVVAPNQPRDDVGFRGVLVPAEVLADLLPKDVDWRKPLESSD